VTVMALREWPLSFMPPTTEPRRNLGPRGCLISPLFSASTGERRAPDRPRIEPTIQEFTASGLVVLRPQLNLEN
jgi:hypothetical protein